MSPFTPAGERARWKILYDLLRAKDVGDTITYRELADAVDLDPDRNRTTIQFALRRAAQEYLVIDKRAVDNLPNEGYRVTEAEEHLRLARTHQRRATRSVRRGQQLLEHVDWDAITDPAARHALQLAGALIARQADVMRRLDIRQRHLEETMAAVTEKSERTDGELDDLRARMARLEDRLSGST